MTIPGAAVAFTQFGSIFAFHHCKHHRSEPMSSFTSAYGLPLISTAVTAILIMTLYGIYITLILLQLEDQVQSR